MGCWHPQAPIIIFTKADELLSRPDRVEADDPTPAACSLKTEQVTVSDGNGEIWLHLLRQRRPILTSTSPMASVSG
ncbi:hypothetical protein ACLOJK_036677 [Asimina triloba]